MTEKKKQKDTDYTFEPVPDHARKSFPAMFFIMLGFTFFSASMSVGARLGNGLELSGFVTAVVLGGIFLSLYAGLLAYIGAETGLSFDLLAQRAFGRQGSKLASLMVALTQIGWFGVGLAMFAIPAAELLGINPIPLVVLAGICMTASAWFGIQGMEIVSYVSVPLIAVLGLYSMYSSISSAGGITSIFTGQGLSLFAGIGLVIGSFISGATATPNFTRFAATKKIAVVTTVIAFFLGNTLMFVFGAVGGAFTGKEDIFYVMEAQGLILPALIVLGANIWTTNDNALYTGGLGLSNLSGIRKKPMVLIAGLIGTVLSVWLYNHFVFWLNFLSAALPPIGAILILDFFMNHDAYEENEDPHNEIRWESVLGVLLGAVLGNLLPWGVASVNAMAIASMCSLAYAWFGK